MSETTALIETTKRLLKSAGKTYQDVADTLFLSEASVKQMFASNRLTIERLDRICNEVLRIEISDLVAAMQNQNEYVTELTEEQERELVEDERLCVVAVSVMNNWTPAEIVQHYCIDSDECQKHLNKLATLKLIAVKPGNRIKLLIDRNFTWRKDGPLQRFFQQQIQNDFLDNSFDDQYQKLIFLTGMLSNRSCNELIRRLERVAAEFLELNREDSKLELQNRSGGSLLLSYRPWEMASFNALRRINQ